MYVEWIFKKPLIFILYSVTLKMLIGQSLITFLSSVFQPVVNSISWRKLLDLPLASSSLLWMSFLQSFGHWQLRRVKAQPECAILCCWWVQHLGWYANLLCLGLWDHSAETWTKESTGRKLGFCRWRPLVGFRGACLGFVASVSDWKFVSFS